MPASSIGQGERRGVWYGPCATSAIADDRRQTSREEKRILAEETLEGQQLQEKVTIGEPAEGWSRDAYERALSDYVAAHGRPPQTITMHPGTMEALGLSAQSGEATVDMNAPILVTSPDYDPATITFYY
jgi:hypothetical protein